MQQTYKTKNLPLELDDTTNNFGRGRPKCVLAFSPKLRQEIEFLLTNVTNSVCNWVNTGEAVK